MISLAYKQQIQDYHSDKQWGGAVTGKVFDIECVASDNDCSSILDFGCGYGAFKQKCNPNKFTVSEYDPGIQGKDTLPTEVFDMVVCVDVMEHVEPQHIDQTLDWIREHTSKVSYFGICCIPSMGEFDDGTNLHKTVRSPDYWLGKLASRYTKYSYFGNNNHIVIKAKHF